MASVTQNPTNETNGHKCASCGSTTTAKRMSGKERWHDIGRGKVICENCYRKQRKSGDIPAGKRGRKTGTSQPTDNTETKARNGTKSQTDDIVQRVLAEVQKQLQGQQGGKVPPQETKQGRPDKKTVEQAKEAKAKIVEILNQKRISDVQKIRDILSVVQGTTT